MSRFLQATCLKPRYSLRFQLFASFGVTSAIAIGVVVLVAALTVKSSGESVKTEAWQLLGTQVIANTRASSEHAADTLSKKFENLEGVVSLLGELTRDRIVGYPDQEWQTDSFVPFADTVTGQNVYPLLADALPADWDIDVNVNSQNYHEHVQDRWEWYADNYPMSTASANYRIQGACDPDETDPQARTYYENCTTANNDFSTGGVVQPTESSQFLAEKAADLAVFLKPLYETHRDVKHMGIYFANSGAGGSLVYPGYHIDGRSSYESGGCDWMRAINPYTNEQYGTEEEIARCHPQGTRVPGREYNPLERQWCRDQALNPQKAGIVGPYLDAFINDLWLLTVGKPVFDRMTGHFLGCTLLDVSIDHISDILESVQLTEYADIALLRWDDAGTVVYSNQWDTSVAVDTIFVDDLEFCDIKTFHSLKDIFDFEKQCNASEWDAEAIKDAFRRNVYNENEQVIAAFPIPGPPEEYNPAYRPEFIVVQVVGEEIYSLIDEMESSIDEDIVWLYVASISIGIVGLSIVLLVSWFVAVYLTRPLNWMMDVCKSIVHHSSEKSNGSITGGDENKPLIRCAPRTEISALVSEFKSIVENFSGDGPASVASPDVHAVLNKVNWPEDFGVAYLQQLYENPPEMGDRRLSFAASIASHHSTATLLDLDEISGDGTEAEKLDVIADMSPVTESHLRVMEEQPALASVQQNVIHSPEVAPDEINVTELEEEKQEATTTHSEAKLQSKPTHLFSCSESTRANKGYITTMVEVDETGAGRFENELRSSISHNQILRSPLFWWIMGLIVVPVLLTMALICTTVTVNVTTVLPSWLEKAEVASVLLEREFVTEASISHAALAQETFVPPIADLHLLTRVAGWLVFGGLKMSGSFTEMAQGTEECKTFPNDGTCPFFRDPSKLVCDCRWNDPHLDTCQNYDNWRARQKQHYAAQAQDADPTTGARTSTSFPAVDFSPSSTLWWDDTAQMPGYSNGTLTQGYGTTFDRMRVMSATAVVTVPLYNYRLNCTEKKHLGIYVGWEADGTLAGYSGCDHSYLHYSHFRSTKENRAHVISPQLCPLWKYGYDSRCRGWYDEGKRTNRLHLTAPYVFAATEEVANSVTFPLVNPESGEHVGQTLIDFLPSSPLSHAATVDESHHHKGFAILVTPKSDALGGDTLAGPGYSMGGTSPPIQDLVLPCDEPSSGNRVQFERTLLASMKKGHANETTFRRRAFERDEDTGKVTCEDLKEETMFIAYRPVAIRESYPLKPTDFSRGVNVSEVLMASLGYVIPENDLAAPFEAIEDQVDEDISRAISILIGLIVATAAIVIVVLAKVSQICYSTRSRYGRLTEPS